MLINETFDIIIFVKIKFLYFFYKNIGYLFFFLELLDFTLWKNIYDHYLFVCFGILFADKMN